MKEKWSTVEEFPTYRVSNYGQVLNQTTRKLMKESITKSGLVKVGLVLNGVQYTRSVCILVADSFVFGRTETFDTPVHLDGDQRNNRADNLVWRPRWFAWKYCRQFVGNHNHDRGPLVDRQSGIWYDRAIDIAVTHGLLVQDIMRSTFGNNPCFPTWQTFSFRE